MAMPDQDSTENEFKEEVVSDLQQVLIVSMGFEEKDGTITVKEWEVVQPNGSYGIYMGLEMVVTPTDERPSGRVTITRIPFRNNES